MLDLTYLDNDPTTDPAELTALFTAVGWNTDGQRTIESTARMLEHIRFFVVAQFMNILSQMATGEDPAMVRAQANLAFVGLTGRSFTTV